MARQKAPIDVPDRIVFPPGSNVKITNTGSQIVYIGDAADELFQVDFRSNTPRAGMPLSPDKTETWWRAKELYLRAAFIGGEIEYSFSAPEEQPQTQAAQPIAPGFVRQQESAAPLSEYSAATFATPLRGILRPK